LIPAGTGLAYHAKRRKDKADALKETTVSASDVEAALSEALSVEDEE